MAGAHLDLGSGATRGTLRLLITGQPIAVHMVHRSDQTDLAVHIDRVMADPPMTSSSGNHVQTDLELGGLPSIGFASLIRNFAARLNSHHPGHHRHPRAETQVAIGVSEAEQASTRGAALEACTGSQPKDCGPSKADQTSSPRSRKTSPSRWLAGWGRETACWSWQGSLRSAPAASSLVGRPHAPRTQQPAGRRGCHGQAMGRPAAMHAGEQVALPLHLTAAFRWRQSEALETAQSVIATIANMHGHAAGSMPEHGGGAACRKLLTTPATQRQPAISTKQRHGERS